MSRSTLYNAKDLRTLAQRTMREERASMHAHGRARLVGWGVSVTDDRGTQLIVTWDLPVGVGRVQYTTRVRL